MAHKMKELRWGYYAETANACAETFLLQTTRQELPASYLDALVSCPLPPGWISHVLPEKLRVQIRTYAKNKLVALLTPVAKKRAFRTNRMQLRDQLAADYAKSVNEAALRKLSSMFDSWSTPALDAVLKCGQLVAYRQGMWIEPPTKRPWWRVDALVILHGVVGEVTLSGIASSASGALPLPVAATMGSAAPGADDPNPLESSAWVGHSSTRGVLASAQAPVAGNTTNPLIGSTTTAHRSREFTAPGILAESRYVLATPSTVGYTAKTNVLLLHIPFQDIARIAETLQPPHRDKYKKYISAHRALQIQSAFPMRIEFLKTVRFFMDMADADLQLLAQAVRPRVAFENEIVIAAGALVPDIIIVCRGQLDIYFPAATNQSGPVDSLKPGDVFGPDYIVFEDRCPLQVAVSPTSICEYWILPANALHAVMKNTLQRKHVVEAAARMREYIMHLTKDPDLLLQTICAGSPHLAAAIAVPFDGSVFAHELLRVAQPRVFKAGDRLANAGEEFSSMLVVVAGRVHKLQISQTAADGTNGTELSPSQVKQRRETLRGSASPRKTDDAVGSGDCTFGKIAVPCVLGETFLLRSRSNASYTTSRMCEVWVFSRLEVWRLIRAESTITNAVRSSIAVGTEAPSSPNTSSPKFNHSVVPPTHTAGRSASIVMNTRSAEVMSDADDAGGSTMMILRSARRAEVRAAAMAEQELREKRENDEILVQERRRRQRLAPTIAHRVPFVAYEGLHPVKPAAKAVYEAVRAAKAAKRECHDNAQTVGRPSSGSSPDTSPLRNANNTADGPVPPSAARRASKGGAVRISKLTVKERLEEEVEEQLLRFKRQLQAVPTGTQSSVMGNRPLTPPHLSPAPSSLATPAPLPPNAENADSQQVNIPQTPPGGSHAEKTVLKQILAQHDAIILAKRTQSQRAMDVSSVSSANPFTSFEPHRPVFRLAPTGELYFAASSARPVSGDSTVGKKCVRSAEGMQEKSRRKKVPFDSRTYKFFSPTSYLSAHAFSEI